MWPIWELTFSYDKETDVCTVSSQQVVNCGINEQDFMGWDLERLAACSLYSRTWACTEKVREFYEVWNLGRWDPFYTVFELRKILDRQAA